MDKVENVFKYVMEKMKELVLVMEKFWGDFVGWMDKVFPPETRGKQINKWFHLAVPFLIGGLVLIMCFCCCRLCCRRVKMMKAPGRGGYRMPRHIFETNPRSYFRSLRSDPTTTPLV
ncbi:hypothetical protein LguiA_000464 [Lonicera macranthoides]